MGRALKPHRHVVKVIWNSSFSAEREVCERLIIAQTVHMAVPIPYRIRQICLLRLQGQDDTSNYGIKVLLAVF